MARRKQKFGTLDDVFGETDDQGMRPQAARDRVALCERFGMTPDVADVECIARDDAKKAGA